MLVRSPEIYTKIWCKTTPDKLLIISASKYCTAPKIYIRQNQPLCNTATDVQNIFHKQVIKSRMAKKRILAVSEFYSKVCVAGSVKFAIDEASKEEISLLERDQFSCNLVMILARDTEMVAINLKILPNKC